MAVDEMYLGAGRQVSCATVWFSGLAGWSANCLVPQYHARCCHSCHPVAVNGLKIGG